MSNFQASLFRVLRTRIEWPHPWQPVWPFASTPTQQAALLHLVEISAVHHVPLLTLLDAQAIDETRVQRIRLNQLRQLIANGTPLTDALESVRGILHPRLLLALRVAVQSGTLAQSVSGIAALATETPPTWDRMLARSLKYAAFVGLIMLTIGYWMARRTSNTLRQLQRDFLEVLAPLPSPDPPTTTNSWPLVAMSFALGTMVVVWLVIHHTRFGRRWLRRIQRYATPFVQLRSADLLNYLHSALTHGRPLSGMLSTLARYHDHRSTRQRLLYVRNEVEQGFDIWDAMQRASLISLEEQHALTSAVDANDLQWMLSLLAQAKQRIAAQRIDNWSRWTETVLVILLGIAAIWLAYSVFQPLVTILSLQIESI